MPRLKIPDHELTEEQRKRRARNERYRGKNASFAEDCNPKSVRLVEPVSNEAIESNDTPTLDRSIETDSTETNGNETKDETSLSNSSHIPTILTLKKRVKFLGLLLTSFKVRRAKRDQVKPSQPTISAVLVSAAIACTLAAAIWMSFHLHYEALLTLDILPKTKLFGYPAAMVMAFILEALFVVLAVLVSTLKSPLERVGSAFFLVLFAACSVAFLVWGTKKATANKIDEHVSQVAASKMDQDLVARIKSRLNTLIQQESAITKQTNPDIEGSYANKGWLGRVGQLNEQLPVVQGKIAALETQLSDLKVAASITVAEPGNKDKVQLMSSVGYVAEGLRILLLAVTAFLIHVLVGQLAFLYRQGTRIFCYCWNIENRALNN